LYVVWPSARAFQSGAMRSACGIGIGYNVFCFVPVFLLLQ
jgi:hypothetical protein